MAGTGAPRRDWVTPLCTAAWRLGRELRALRRRTRLSSPQYAEIRKRAQRFFETRLPVVERYLPTSTPQERYRVQHCLAAVAVGAGGRFPEFLAMRRRLLS